MLIVQPVLVAALFVTSYPYLWSAPIERTRILFDFRRFEMNNQAGWPQAAITSRVEAFERTWQNLNDRTSLMTASRPPSATRSARTGRAYIDLYLAVPGIVFLVYLAWRNGLASQHALAALTIGGQSALILGRWESTSIATTCPCCSPRPSVSGCSLAVLASGCWSRSEG